LAAACPRDWRGQLAWRQAIACLKYRKGVLPHCKASPQADSFGISVSRFRHFYLIETVSADYSFSPSPHPGFRSIQWEYNGIGKPGLNGIRISRLGRQLIGAGFKAGTHQYGQEYV